MIKPILAVVLVLATLQLTSCSDRMAVSPAILKVTPRHHSLPINDCMIYIKYGTREKPTVFDDSARCELVGGVPVASFRHLKTGNYYVFGRGYDASINEPVAGGAPLTVHVGADFTYNLSVTEASHK